MKKLFTILIIGTLAFIGCEKECPVCPNHQEEICWECVTTYQKRYYYCPGFTGPAYSETVIIDNETICGLTQSQIDAKEEANTFHSESHYECGATNQVYSYIRHNYKMTCTKLE